MLTRLLDHPDLKTVWGLLTARGHDIRFVGGCVRDAILGIEAKDTDLATTMPAEDLLNLLKEHHYTVVPTGLAHGTVTLVLNHRPYEITTLRRDVATHGRHATIAYTDDWREDAARRDFTINAMYMDFEGGLHDYFNGQGDLKAGIIRFIGKAEDRIQEDYLRILRFFRFYARYAKVPADPETLGVCEKLAPGMDILSRERVTQELMQILQAPDPRESLRLMDQHHLLKHVVRGADLTRCSRAIGHEFNLNLEPLPLRRLAALTLDTHGLKLSNAQHQLIRSIHTVLGKLGPDLQVDNAWNYLVYVHGKETVMDAVLLAATTTPTDQIAWLKSLKIPPFPLSGQDIVDLGIPAGPRIKAILTKCEKHWALEDFKPTKEKLLLISSKTITI